MLENQWFLMLIPETDTSFEIEISFQIESYKAHKGDMTMLEFLSEERERVGHISVRESYRTFHAMKILDDKPCPDQLGFLPSKDRLLSKS